MADRVKSLRALAQFAVTQASMRADPWGRPLDPCAFLSMWLNANSDRSVVTAYTGNFDIILELLEIIAKEGNPSGSIETRLLCYDNDNIIRAVIPYINELMGKTRYIGESAFLLALTSYEIPAPDGVTDWVPRFFTNQHTATQVVDLQRSAMPMALDSYHGGYFTDLNGTPASYWQMIQSQLLDLSAGFKFVTWAAFDDATDLGGAIGVGYSTGWPPGIAELNRQGFYNCISADKTPAGRTFYVSERRQRTDQLCSPYPDGRNPKLPVNMLRDIFGGAMSIWRATA